ncbi:ornithine--oxo-acid transaminase [Streptomyces sp. CBMA29]|uniref:ornithine--oxo-acid transaminase n=1 Tax=Streptomyces sp. CBMA29 TaxID=1896314 RepID=UPI002948B7A1|nr:ornithine--oxo-acid transaminase [Streptomyces sp. CBMA29]MBD0736049.1 ornithine--oxo-acid transaminase [Streptomyces sp. CBMA29]
MHAGTTTGTTVPQRRVSRLANNYSPLPVRAESARGVWVTDASGSRFLDMLSAYSAMNFGHGNPTLLAAAHDQLAAMTLISRAYDHTGMERYAAALSDLAGKDMMVPMNTGAEAVETAVKVARKWAYEVKGVRENRAEIIVASGNFHGRTTTVVGFSDDPDARNGFGPFTPGFVTVAYGDAAALEAAITPDTAAVLLEPVQGEAGVIIPDAGYLPAVRRICDEQGVLFLADEIQSGLGRTGETFACDHVAVTPDVYILGKALGGGIVPASAVVADSDVLGVLRPGQHGSTFGGNPLACRIGTAVVDLLKTGEYQERARTLGALLRDELAPLVGRGLVSVRTIGLWAGIDVDPSLATGRTVCEELARRGVLAKDTHGSTVRLSPPLVIEPSELSWGVAQLADVLRALA